MPVKVDGGGATDGNNPTGGQWLPGEIQHINSLEMKAAYFAVNHIVETSNLNISGS